MFNGKKTIALPLLLDSFSYSMSILVISFFIALVLAISLSYLYEISSSRVRKVVLNLLEAFESIPDVMLIILLQLGVVYIYKFTGILVADIATFGEERSYLLPLICLSFGPTVFLFRMIIFEINKERIQPYVEFVTSRGFSKSYILFRHIYPNIIIYLLNYSRTIFLFMLSNVMIIEILFNINGYINFFKGNLTRYTFDVCFLWLVLLVTPFFVLNSILLFIVSKWNGGEVID
jgi:peptide/nickel transport system permease protein